MPFQVADFGQVFQTAEAIKSMRRQSTLDSLREQYLGEQIQGMQTDRARQQRLDDITLGKENAQKAYTAMQYVMQAPNPKSFVEQNFPELVSNLTKQGVPWENVDDDVVKQMAQGIMAKAGAEIGQGPAPAPVQLETIETPDGGILQRDPTTGKLTPVINPNSTISTLRALQSDPGLAATDMARRRAVAPQVSVRSTQETAEHKALGSELGKQYAAIQKAGADAGFKVSRYQRMDQLLTGVRTGKLTPKLTEVAALADSLGIKLDSKIGEKQAVQALANEVALQLRNPSGGAGMPGALSDKDREFLVSMTPGLAKTPEGNKLIIQSAIKLAKRDQEVAKLAREYRTKNGTLEGFSEYLAQWSEQNPLFEAESAAATPDMIYVPGQGLRPAR